jgi:hypothetical protein
MYGVYARVGERTVEVARAEAGRWYAFMRIDGRMCKRLAVEPANMGYAEAKALAARFLRGEVTPEVWMTAEAREVR